MGDIFSDGYIESGRSVGGRPYTQFNILRSIFPNENDENFNEDKRNYTIFWRIDTINVGPYISIFSSLINLFTKKTVPPILCPRFWVQLIFNSCLIY